VSAPFLSPWVKELRYCVRFGVDTRQIRTFVEITIDARQGEVVDVIGAAVLLGDDMLDMQGGKRRIILMQLTVFATIAGARSDKRFC
jgi:hypothetical protein